MHAHFDCFAGISGDMSLGALIDLGVPVDWLKAQLDRIPLSGFEIRAERVARHGIGARRVTVHVSEGETSRSWKDIRRIITTGSLPSPVKKTSLSIFRRIAEAEAQIHQEPVEEVHFHELGGIDAMVDIIGTALCIDYLGIQTVTASEIALGRGTVSCRHGNLPVPTPATVSILKGIPVYGTEIQHELVTPTGAAIIAELAGNFGPLPRMIIQKSGYGAGTRDHATIPNVLRVVTGNKTAHIHEKGETAKQRESVIMVETVIDDMNPEFFGYVMEQLYRDGALDVCWIPAYMKKNRPGTLVQVVCQDDCREAVVTRLFTETTSLGVRYYEMRRDTLFREIVEVDTSYGTVAVKRVVTLTGETRLVPEYEVCRKIALKHDQPLRVVYETLLKEIAAR